MKIFAISTSYGARVGGGNIGEHQVSFAIKSDDMTAELIKGVMQGVMVGIIKEEQRKQKVGGLFGFVDVAEAAPEQIRAARNGEGELWALSVRGERGGRVENRAAVVLARDEADDFSEKFAAAIELAFPESEGWGLHYVWQKIPSTAFMPGVAADETGVVQ